MNPEIEEAWARLEAYLVSAQKEPSVVLADWTLRQEANALTLACFRNGFLEDLHSDDRIDDPEMKKLMIESSALVARWLFMRDLATLPRRGAGRRGYQAFVGLHTLLSGVSTWECEATTHDIPDDAYAGYGGKCCDRYLASKWRFCPHCGAVASIPSSGAAVEPRK